MARDDDRRRRNAASRVRTPSVFSDTGVAGGAYLALPPDQNPAYQAAIAKGRPSRGGYTTIPTRYGTMSVPKGQESKYAALIKGADPEADRVALQEEIAGRLNAPQAYAAGFGTPNYPARQPQGGLGFLAGNVAGGIANFFSPQRDLERLKGVASFATNAASRVGGLVGGLFGGGTPNIIPSANAGAPTPTPPAIPTGSPTATPTAAPITGQPLADGRTDLLRDTENTFFGGGNAPVPTPTPTASPAARIASNQPSALDIVQAIQQGSTAGRALAQNRPRRYSDLYP